MISGEDWDLLCRKLKESDRPSFERLYRLQRNDLLKYVFSIVRDATVSHDLVQDVFVAVWELRLRLDPEQPLKAYLYRMARNRAYRHLRDERLHDYKHQLISRESSHDPELPAEVEHRVDGDLLSNMLKTWIHDLPARQREALVLSRFHDLSHREIASVMGLSPRTVNVHIMRALERLQKRAESFEPALTRP